MFDKNGDGKISKGELKDVMKSMGFDPTEEEVQGRTIPRSYSFSSSSFFHYVIVIDMIANADKGGKKYIEFDEFLELMVKKVRVRIKGGLLSTAYPTNPPPQKGAQ